MKNLSMLPILCLSLVTLVTVSCAEDKPVTDKATRDRITGQKNSSNNSKQNTRVIFEGSALSINMIERLSEGLNLARIALNKGSDARVSVGSDGESNRLKVNPANYVYTKVSGGRGQASDFVLIEDKEFEFNVGSGDSEEIVVVKSVVVESSSIETDGSISNSNGKQVISEKAALATLQGQSVNFVTDSYELKLSKSTEDTSKYLVDIKMSGNYNATIAGKYGSEIYRYHIKGLVDIDSLSTDSVSVEKIEASYTAMHADNPENVKFPVSLTSSKLAFGFGECATITGSVVASYSRKNYPLNFTVDRVSDINPRSPKTVEFAACANRPIVDLMSLLTKIGYYN